MVLEIAARVTDASSGLLSIRARMKQRSLPRRNPFRTNADPSGTRCRTSNRERQDQGVGECWVVRVGSMGRVVTVEFGPSRSKRFGNAVAEARSGAGGCTELAPNRYRTRFALGSDCGAYMGLARLLERVRHWRASEVYEDDEPVSADHAREMAWCASGPAEGVRRLSLPLLLGCLAALFSLSPFRRRAGDPGCAGGERAARNGV